MPRYCTRCQIGMEETTKDIEFSDNGEQFVVPNVKAYKCSFCGRFVYDVEALIKARVVGILRINGLYANDSPAVFLLYSPGPRRNHEEIRGITLFQKEEFYAKDGLKGRPSVVPFPIFRPMQG